MTGPRAATRKAGPVVVVRSQGGPHHLSLPTIRTRARRMLEAVDHADCELTVLLVDDDSMRELNKTWRGKDATTDVLSFAMREGEYAELNPQLLGDVVISVPTASRQASQARRTTIDEVTMLLAHGLLHLLGYDHQTPSTHRDMVRRTRLLVDAAIAGGKRHATNRR
jgi:probable rRNA maturation factor